MERIKEVEMIKYSNGRAIKMSDTIVVEYSLTIVVNGIELITLSCSPNALDFLAVGYLKTEGIIQSKEEILSIRSEPENNRVYIEIADQNIIPERMKIKPTKASGGAKGSVSYNDPNSLGDYVVDSNLTVDADKIIEFTSILTKSSELFENTGGVHSTILCSPTERILFHDDVGRHNSVDKIIGEALLKDISLEDKIMVCSGRISSEMLYKALKNRIPIIISKSAPMNLSIENAKKRNATLVCFVRENRMNVYSGAHRINFPNPIEE